MKQHFKTQTTWPPSSVMNWRNLVSVIGLVLQLEFRWESFLAPMTGEIIYHHSVSNWKEVYWLMNLQTICFSTWDAKAGCCHPKLFLQFIQFSWQKHKLPRFVDNQGSTHCQAALQMFQLPWSVMSTMDHPGRRIWVGMSSCLSKSSFLTMSCPKILCLWWLNQEHLHSLWSQLKRFLSHS